VPAHEPRRADHRHLHGRILRLKHATVNSHVYCAVPSVI
jgi:hypothetical protein